MNTEIKKESRNTFIKLIVLELIIFSLVLLIKDVKYEVSDDFIMELMLSGTYSGSANAHLLFSNYLWGLFLALFYKLTPVISWYLVWQMIVGLMSYIALARVLSRKMNFACAAGLLLVFNLGTIPDIVVLPQFTRTAAFAMIAGGILFLQSLFEHDSICDSILGGLLFTAGSLIRFKMLYAALPFLLLYLLVELFTKRSENQYRKLIHIAGILILVFCLNSLGKALGRNTKDYQYFSRWTTARSQYIDYKHPVYSEISSELEQAGITENTYEMINNWQYADPKDPDLAKMKTLLEIVYRYRDNHKPHMLEVTDTARQRSIKRYPGFIVCVLLGLICCLTKKKRWLVPAGCCFILTAYFLYFAYVERQVYRVESACFIYAAAVILSSVDILGTEKHTNLLVYP